MADNTTSWVLKFMDMVSSPVKSMMKTISSATSSFSEMGKASALTSTDIKANLNIAKESLKGLKEDLKLNEAKLKDLGKELKKTAPGMRKIEVQKAFKKQAEEVEFLKRRIAETTTEVKDFTDQLANVPKEGAKWAELAVRINQTSEVIKKVTNSLKFTVDYKEQEKEIQRLTDLTGDALTEYTKKSREIADVYGQDAVNVAKSVNAMANQFGGSYEENFELLEEGFKRGADLSGNLLSNMERYSGAFADMGISASDAMVIMAKAEKEGISGDKAIESIKKAGDAITELAPRQKTALEGIGVGIEELAGKTKWEAIRMVSESMQGMTEQAKQNVLARVFGEAGKESGSAFVQNLAEEIPDLSTLPAVEESASGFKRFFSNVKSWAGDAFGNIGIYATQMAPMVQVIAGAVPIINTLTKSQWLLNIAMNANPVGLIIAAITVLIGYVAIAINYWDDFGAAMMVLLGPIGILIGAFKSIYDHWDSIKKAFKDGGILEGLKRIGIVLLDAVFKPLQQILELIAKIDPTGLAKKALKEIKEFREENDLVTEGEEKSQEKETSDDLSINKIIRGNPTEITFDDDEAKKKGKNKKESGLSISGKGGAANITMTINNYFTASAGTNIRQLADQVAGKISDRLQDAIVSV